MNTLEVSGISAGLGAMTLAKQLRRINEVMNPKMVAMQQAMKVAKVKGVAPKEALKSMKGKV